ncbi:hypothetical protein [Tuberibacillus sp. Marseille-P3662]|uniref:hypothetical protein n=1 Tax=Tuberibacillus sp. Marseille-P3662 TaxID=1965358 RepID=UPI000A1CD31A|nr:hypothetical protein [Tuberibacillus sp. Marseille-P3662]
MEKQIGISDHKLEELIDKHILMSGGAIDVSRLREGIEAIIRENNRALMEDIKALMKENDHD